MKGVNRSNGVNLSNGVCWSDGVLNSFGVDSEIFCADKARVYRIFGIDVSELRFDEVWKELHEKLGGWFPKFHNGFKLYVQNGCDWKKVDVSEMCDTLEENDPNDSDFDPYEAWKDMPKEAMEYLKSLPEFDKKIFKRVTGIDVDAMDNIDSTTQEAIELLQKNGYKVVKE